MKFNNGATLKGLMEVGRDVSVFILKGGETISSLPHCKTFVKDGRPWVDCAPLLNGKYTAPVPENALVSQRVDALVPPQTDGRKAVGEYGVFVSPGSRLGRLVEKLFAARESYDQFCEKSGDN